MSTCTKREALFYLVDTPRITFNLYRQYSEGGPSVNGIMLLCYLYFTTFSLKGFRPLLFDYSSHYFSKGFYKKGLSELVNKGYLARKYRGTYAFTEKGLNMVSDFHSEYKKRGGRIPGK